MIHSHAITLKNLPSRQRSGNSRSTTHSALLVVTTIAPLAILLLLASACRAPDPQDSEIVKDEIEETSGLDPEPLFMPPQQSCPNEECFGITCPDGFSRVGPPGVRGSFCIAQQQEPATTFLQSMTECFTTSTSTGAVPHLCTLEEWYIACSQGEDVGEESIDDMTNAEWEWVSDAFTKNTAMVIGNGSCSKTAAGTTSKNIAFRCCVS